MIRSYQVRGKTVEVDQLPDVLAIRLPDGPPEAREPGEAVARWRGQTLVILGESDIPPDTCHALETAGWLLVRSVDEPQPDAEWPEPVAVGYLFRDQRGECMVGTGRLSVRLRDELGDEEARRALERHGLRVVRRLRFAPQLYEVQVADDDDFIDVAGQLQDSEEYVYAEPQLIRKIAGR